MSRQVYARRRFAALLDDVGEHPLPALDDVRAAALARAFDGWPRVRPGRCPCWWGTRPTSTGIP
ncbi:hypothetical protein ABZW30_42705 [Kitasatospora sp. NPDC004669]|uniref:hypothetical protein n=1 Tax=Kitasatospora sp. NPDC004669 TaxID=3154555 RepID=UPI0033AFDE34